MRIVCQSCSAAYAVDDKHITAKGIRAQCPRCRHLQLVKKDDPAAAAAAPAPADASPFDFGQPPPPAPPAGPATGDAPPPAGGPAAAAAAAQASSPFDFSATKSAAFDFDSPPPPPPPSFPSARAQPAPAAAAPAPAQDDPFDAVLAAHGQAPAAAAPEVPRCKTCGVDLNDPFDQALGTCDDCRNKAASAAAPSAGDGKIEHIDVGGLQAQLAGGATAPAGAAPVAAAPASHAPRDPAAMRTAFRDGSSPGRGKAAAALLGLVAIVGAAAGGWYYLRKPKKAPPLVVKAATATKPVEQVVAQWKLSFPELEGAKASEAESYLAQGEELLAKDTGSAYHRAEEAFQKALVLDPTSDRALAGYVLSLAFGRGASLDDATAKSAESMLEAARARGADPLVYTAQAHFIASRDGNPNDITVLAERGKTAKSTQEQALALLALGQAQLSKNVQMGEATFAQALKLDPRVKRGHLFQAKLAISVGRYRDAANSLEKRLELDADQLEAAEDLARLYVDVGEPAKAKAVLQKARTADPRSARAKVLMAMLAMQHLGDPGQAAELLRGVVGDPTTSRPELTAAYVQLSALQRIQGDAEGAKDSAERALEHSPDSVPAKLQLFLALLDKGVNSQARLELDALKGKLGAGSLEQTLEGRLLFAEGRFDQALTVLTKVADADPSRVDALLLAGAAAANARKDGKAWELCLKRGLQTDPWAMPVDPMSWLYVRPADLLKPALGSYHALSTSKSEDPNPELCEGLMAWHSEQTARAVERFTRVNQIDGNNADALTYRAFAALRRNEAAGATKLASRAIDLSRANGASHLALGTANLVLNKLEVAKRELDAAVKYSPKLLGAKVLLADIEMRLKAPDEARKILNGVLLTDPHYREAKRVLYKHSL